MPRMFADDTCLL